MSHYIETTPSEERHHLISPKHSARREESVRRHAKNRKAYSSKSYYSKWKKAENLYSKLIFLRPRILSSHDYHPPLSIEHMLTNGSAIEDEKPYGTCDAIRDLYILHIDNHGLRTKMFSWMSSAHYLQPGDRGSRWAYQRFAVISRYDNCPYECKYFRLLRTEIYSTMNLLHHILYENSGG